MAAAAAAGLRNQKPIRRYEQAPTASQKTYTSRKLLAATSIDIENTNAATSAKNRG